MTQSKIKTILALVLLCASGLCGCDTSGQREKSGGNLNPWAVETVGLWRENEQYLDFKNSGEKLKNYELTDIIRFSMPQKNKIENAQIKITTSCFKENEAITPYTFTENMHETYNLYELLPADTIFALHDLGDKAYTCGFEVVVQNSKGDSHEFKLPAAPILNRTIQNPLVIFKGYKNVSSNLDKQIEISQADWGSYFLPQLNSENVAYEFICTNQRGQASFLNQDQSSPISAPISFEQFDLVSEDAPTQKFLKISSAQYCRVFLQNQKGRILKMSNLFMIKPGTELPIITTLRSGSLEQGGYVSYMAEMATYKIQNPSAAPMVVGFDSSQASQIELQVYILSGRDQHGTLMQHLLKVDIAGVSVVQVHNQLRFVIQPEQFALVSFSFRIPSIQCDGYQIRGFYYYRPNKKGLELKIFDDLNAPAIRLHELDRVEMEPRLPRYMQFLQMGGLGEVVKQKPIEPPLSLDNIEAGCRSR